MAKCMHRWTDPLAGKIETTIGPYTCGRKPSHKGAHAWDGNGAAALWTNEGLLFSVQSLPERPGGWLPALVDADELREALEVEGSVDATGLDSEPAQEGSAQ